MTNQNVVPPVVEVETVDSLIKAAGSASETMYGYCRKAADMAAKELDLTKTTADAVAIIMAGHKSALSSVTPNIKTIFSDFLWLHAAPKSEVVEILIPDAQNKAHPANVKAADAIDASKHNMRSAAQQVRAAAGVGRVRKAKVAAATPAADAAADAKVEAVSKDMMWFDMLATKLQDAGEVAKIVAALERAGYKVTKGNKMAKAATPAQPAAVAGLAAQLKAAAPAILAAAQ